MLYRPAELIAFLKKIDHRPLKRLSQNFLIDGNVVKKILKTAAIQPADTVLEIGPGAGVLTEALLEQKVKKVIAIEADKLLAQQLSRLGDKEVLVVYPTDFLKIDLAEILPAQKIKVVANLPYHIASQILIKLLYNHQHFNSLTLMLQKEMAQRLVALPCNKTYGQLTIQIDFFCEEKSSFPVSKNCFYPKPEVDSTMVHFKLRKEPLLKNKTAFLAFVKLAFQQRRKKISSTLSAQYPKTQIEDFLKQLGKEKSCRPEELSCLDFINLFSLLS